MTDAANISEGVADQESKTSGAGNWDRRSNLFSLLLMALATLGSAWSGYQSSLWDGIQTFLLMDAAGLSRESNEKAMIASQQRALDAALFVEYSRDFYEGKTRLAEFFLTRSRPELRQAIQAWMATQPAKNPNAPPTPFLMPQYRLAADEEARELDSKSNAAYDRARKANLNTDTFSLLGVLFTASLFLAGLVSGFADRRTRRAILILSFSVLLTATVVLMSLPIAHRG